MSGREQLVAAYLRLHPESAARLLESMPVEQANAVLECRRRRDGGARRRPHAADLRRAVRRAAAAGRCARCCSSGSAARNPSPCCGTCRSSMRESGAELARPAMGHGVQAAAELSDEHRRRVGRAARAHVTRRLHGRRRARPHRAQRAGRPSAHLRARPRRAACAAPCAASRCCRCRAARSSPRSSSLPTRSGRATPLATAQEHSVWERHTEAPVVNRDEEFIGVISYADLRKAFRQVNRVAEPNGDREIAEVTELIAIGAGSVWRSLGDLIGTDRRTVNVMDDAARNVALDRVNRQFLLAAPGAGRRRHRRLRARGRRRAARRTTKPTRSRTSGGIFRRRASTRSCRRCPRSCLKQALHVLDPGVLAISLPRISEESRNRCLALLPRRTEAEVRRLMDYPAGSAGRVMDSRIPSFRGEQPAGRDARAASAEQAEGSAPALHRRRRAAPHRHRRHPRSLDRRADGHAEGDQRARRARPCRRSTIARRSRRSCATSSSTCCPSSTFTAG